MDGATIGKESQERVVDVGMTKKKKRGWMGRDVSLKLVDGDTLRKRLNLSAAYRDAAMDNPHATRSHPSSGNNQGTPSHSDIVDIQEVPSDYPPPKRSRSRSPSRLRYEDRHHTNNSNPSPYLTPTSAVPLGRQYLSPTPASGLTVPTNASTPTGFDHSNGLSPPVSALAPSRTSGRGTSTSPVVQKLVPNSTATSVITTTGKGGKKDALKTGVKRDVPTAHVMKKEDGDACTREDIQVGFGSFTYICKDCQD